MRETSDEDLMRKMAEGSAAAFDEVFRRHSGRVLGYCSRLVGEKAAGEDLAQDVWVKVIKAASDWEPRAGVRAWLLTIARNTALNYLRDRMRTALTEDGEAPEDELRALERPSVEELISRDEDQRLLTAAMDRLPDAKRAALVMWLMEEMSYERIGVELGVSVANVKTILFRAKKELQTLITELGGGRR